MEMRAVYAECLAELMTRDRHVCVLDADLAKASGTRALYERFPNQMFDCGVAEQNMASIAAGLASYGFKPYIESFTPFATRRICDQIAISISYAKNNVKIVGTDPGISAELNGGTHMSMEDIGVLRRPADGVFAGRAALCPGLEHGGGRHGVGAHAEELRALRQEGQEGGNDGAADAAALSVQDDNGHMKASVV